MMRVALVLALALLIGAVVALLSACSPPAQIVRTQTVEVPKYIRTPIPAKLIEPTVVAEPAPLCGSTFCNGQLATMLGDYRSGLGQCNADKTALRELNTSNNQPE
jgi:hypothetical protein